MKFTATNVNQSKITQGSLEATVLRCNCGVLGTGHSGAECPTPLVINYGTVAYYHKSIWKRIAYFVARLFNKSATFWKD